MSLLESLMLVANRITWNEKDGNRFESCGLFLPCFYCDIRAFHLAYCMVQKTEEKRGKSSQISFFLSVWQRCADYSWYSRLIWIFHVNHRATLILAVVSMAFRPCWRFTTFWASDQFYRPEVFVVTLKEVNAKGLWIVNFEINSIRKRGKVKSRPVFISLALFKQQVMTDKGCLTGCLIGVETPAILLVILDGFANIPVMPHFHTFPFFQLNLPSIGPQNKLDLLLFGCHKSNTRRRNELWPDPRACISIYWIFPSLNNLRHEQSTHVWIGNKKGGILSWRRWRCWWRWLSGRWLDPEEGDSKQYHGDPDNDETDQDYRQNSADQQ